jgi:hypothetical protein
MPKPERPCVLLVGNGPNRVAGNSSWASLLNDVSQAVGGTPVSEEDYRTTPFPILYERLLLEARRNRNWTETRLKEEIAERNRSVKSGDIHRAIMAAPFDEVMTTNYDQALEQVLAGPAPKVTGSPLVPETRYSLFRHVQASDGRTLWYIHGDCRRPTSILLGYEQYSGFLQQMRLYVTAGVHYQKLTAGPVFRCDKRTQDRRSWVTRFFDADVWILGLGLDFVEIHLWWLLTYRARLRSRSIATTNVIRYMCRGGAKGEGAKLAMLRTLDVETHVICDRETEWGKYYQQSLGAIEAMLPNTRMEPSRAGSRSRAAHS